MSRIIFALPSDTHSGSAYGLSPLNWKFSDGGEYKASPIQEIIYKQWQDGWLEIALLRQPGDRLVIAVDGDAVEGLHHQSTQVTSLRDDEHVRMHVSVMKEIMEVTGFKSPNNPTDELIYIGGTPTHVRTGAISEEIIARMLKARPYTPPTLPDAEDGRFVWPCALIELNGVLFDISHEGPGPGLRTWLTGNNLRYTIRSHYFYCLENKIKLPRYYVRAHRHVWIEPETHSGSFGTITGMITPSFQLKTEHANRRAANMLVNVGMLYFIIEENGETSWHCPRISIEQDRIIAL